jgi:aminomethyltransferase
MQKLRFAPLSSGAWIAQRRRGAASILGSSLRAYTVSTHPPLTSRKTSNPSCLHSRHQPGIRSVPAAARSHSTVRQTALHDFHVEHGGKMVPFGGFSMPLQYEDQSIVESHRFTREKASLFDVGHMCVESYFLNDLRASICLMYHPPWPSKVVTSH